MKYRFEPKPDITAYELALIMSRIVFSPLTSLNKSGVQEPPPEIMEKCGRHFVPIEDTKAA